ncbi:MAG: hypothetical protein K2O58_05895 [Bacteroidales bacterium]|nr:hypothetical protein [Bacteroidales bacterium]
MKKCFWAALLLIVSCLASSGQEKAFDSTGCGVSAMFWNLENFFDCIDNGGSDSDREFSPGGQRHWTRSRFYAKCNGIAKTIFWVQDLLGGLPDVVGLAEVENRLVLNSLLKGTALRKTDYAIVHFDSPDPRGIDVALLYRTDVFRKISSNPCRIYDSEGRIVRTRDILCVELCRKSDGRTMYFLINHHPSKFGGASASHSRRMSAMARMKDICDSIVLSCAEGADSSPACLAERYKAVHIISMGDFNDTPDNGLFSIFDGYMANLADVPFRKGEGTIRYAGKWDLIDMFLVSSGIADGYVQEILYPPFLMTEDRTHGGQKPLRTYSGPRHEGGVSDHCPIVMRRK